MGMRLPNNRPACPVCSTRLPAALSQSDSAVVHHLRQDLDYPEVACGVLNCGSTFMSMQEYDRHHTDTGHLELKQPFDCASLDLWMYLVARFMRTDAGQHNDVTQRMFNMLISRSRKLSRDQRVPRTIRNKIQLVLQRLGEIEDEDVISSLDGTEGSDATPEGDQATPSVPLRPVQASAAVQPEPVEDPAVDDEQHLQPAELEGDPATSLRRRTEVEAEVPGPSPTEDVENCGDRPDQSTPPAKKRLRKRHNVMEKRWTCTYCSTETKRFAEIRQHIKQTHKTVTRDIRRDRDYVVGEIVVGGEAVDEQSETVTPLPSPVEVAEEARLSPNEVETVSPIGEVAQETRETTSSSRISDAGASETSMASGSNSLYQCKECSEKFDYYKELRNHLQSTHSVKPTDLKQHYTKVAIPACCVCGEQDSSLLHCIGCRIAVHAKCYGTQLIDNSCDRCRISSAEVRCELCDAEPFRGRGAFKQTTNGKWVHIVCVLYTSLAKFENSAQRSGACLTAVDVTGGKKCADCEIETGVPVSCSYDNCDLALHVPCAQKHGFLRMQNTPMPSNPAECSPIQFKLFCYKHVRASDDLPGMIRFPSFDHGTLPQI